MEFDGVGSLVIAFSFSFQTVASRRCTSLYDLIKGILNTFLLFLDQTGHCNQISEDFVQKLFLTYLFRSNNIQNNI